MHEQMIQRLRDNAKDVAREYDNPVANQMEEAADEIERLVNALTQIAKLDYSRAAINSCALTAVSIAKVALHKEVSA